MSGRVSPSVRRRRGNGDDARGNRTRRPNGRGRDLVASRRRRADTRSNRGGAAQLRSGPTTTAGSGAWMDPFGGHARRSRGPGRSRPGVGRGGASLVRRRRPPHLDRRHPSSLGATRTGAASPLWRWSRRAPFVSPIWSRSTSSPGARSRRWRTPAAPCSSTRRGRPTSTISGVSSPRGATRRAPSALGVSPPRSLCLPATAARAGFGHALAAVRFKFAVEIGARLNADGRHAEAARAYRPAEVVEPTNAVVLADAGAAEVEAGRFGRGQVPLRRAVLLAETDASAWTNLGQALRMMGADGTASAVWRRALRLEPSPAGPLAALAARLADADDTEGAAALITRAARLEPEGALSRRVESAVALQRYRADEADAACRRGLVLDPAMPGLLSDRSRVADLASARFNRGMTSLRGGRIAQGWEDYRARFVGGQAEPHRRFSIPEWDGSPLDGRRSAHLARAGGGRRDSPRLDLFRGDPRGERGGDRTRSPSAASLPTFLPRRARPSRAAGSGRGRRARGGRERRMRRPYSGGFPAALFRRRWGNFPADRRAWLHPNIARAAES